MAFAQETTKHFIVISSDNQVLSMACRTPRRPNPLRMQEQAAPKSQPKIADSARAAFSRLAQHLFARD